MPQKALLLTHALTAPDAKFVVADIAVPEPGPGHVLIAVHAAALNPVDWIVAETGRYVSSWPTGLGMDAAGVVERLGEGVVKFGVGDRVMFAGTVAGPTIVTTFQQFVVMSVDFVAKVPSNISLDQAATMPCTVATAAFGLYQAKQQPLGGLGLTPVWEEGGRGKYAGEPIVIIAGATGVGQHTIQFAKLSGFSPIITTASPHNAAYLKSLGATHVLDRALPLSALPARVRAITAKPVLYGYDAVSVPETQNALFDAVAPGGQILLVKRTVAVDEAKVVERGTYVARVFGDVQAPGMQEIGRTLYAHFTQLVEAGEIKPTRLEVLPDGLAGIPDGLQRLKKGISALKFVAHPQETS
ncbi:zinc-binding alcohol dehydrogenase family protein [Phanerochaete sordida]|uniref:Zinc-binding alcohol dehydrogenase family protein n=1 Tax=Phanerochaete sordida TaxID=48140 RepID=A0A9P3G7S5_9APHY|nr:zinc-binding alcohol dehydrogenase family protein [Phanerochaete sordida]